MGRYRMDPRKQFSKRLARWTAVFWFAYMTWLSVIMLWQPQAALFCVYMGIMVTVVMIFMTVAYTHNSVAEKMALALIDKTQMELSLKGISSTKILSPDTEDESTEEPVEEEPADEEGGMG